MIRAGGGMYYGANMQTNFQYTGPAYFKNAVSYFTKDNYETQYATLENPFPNGVPAPQGNKDVEQVVREMLEYRDRQNRTLGGITTRELVEEGRRY